MVNYFSIKILNIEFILSHPGFKLKKLPEETSDNLHVRSVNI